MKIFKYIIYSSCVLLTAGAIFVGLGWLKDQRPADLGNPFEWTRVEDKQNVADVPALTVKDPEFVPGVHVVEKGENYWGICKKAGIDLDTLIGLNPELENLDAWISQPLLVAGKKGALYMTGEGDTLDSIAGKLKVEKKVLSQTNQIPWYGLKPGFLLFVPGISPVMLTKEMKAAFERRGRFRSPLPGRLSSLMGVRFDPFTGFSKRHNGVDIAAPFNSWVGAAAEGKVIYAGWNGGYGKCVKIRHADGFMTLYGHLNSILVKNGQQVHQHQFIGKVGTTGRTTGPHLHFTIYEKEKAVDPLKFLW